MKDCLTVIVLSNPGKSAAICYAKIFFKLTSISNECLKIMAIFSTLANLIKATIKQSWALKTQKSKQLWGLRTDPSCLLKKCILVIDLGQIVSLESFQPLSIMLFPIKGKIQLFLKTPIVG